MPILRKSLDWRWDRSFREIASFAACSHLLIGVYAYPIRYHFSHLITMFSLFSHVRDVENEGAIGVQGFAGASEQDPTETGQ